MNQEDHTVDLLPDSRTLEILQHWFGHSAFREGQYPPIREILSGKDAVVVMPTGSGKSLCYQMAAMLLPHTTLVISPLIALMKDQVDALQKRGIPATCLNSSIDPDEMHMRLAELERGRYKLVYIAPERFRSTSFMNRLRRTKLSLLTIDEAHCISQWGHDFRPDYLNIRRAMGSLGRIPVMAVTATATPDVRKDIIRQLGLGEDGRDAPYIQVQGFARHNLYLSVTPCRTHQQKLSHILSLARKYRSGIIYVATRKQADRVYGMLKEKAPLAGLEGDILLYHGALSDDERVMVQEHFIASSCPIVVATNAFGMGVDRSDIRFVAHWDVPGSIEAYYQEVGRAGRDGQPAYCELLFNYADVRTQQFFIDGANPSRQDLDTLVSTLQKYCGQEPQRYSVDQWAELADIKNPMSVQTLFGILERSGIITRVQEPGQRICTTALSDHPDYSVLYSNFEARQTKSERDNARLQEMLHFVDTPGCRHAFILSYFGENISGSVCNGCDHCGMKANAKPPTEEQWVILQKILSCVGRMRGRFGAKRISQVLRGDNDPHLKEKGLTELSTFGILPDLPDTLIRRLLDLLVSAGCGSIRDDKYKQIVLTDYGKRVAFRLVPDFLFPWPEEEEEISFSASAPSRRRRGQDGTSSPTESSIGACASGPLREKLRAWRTSVAQGMPAYRVINNATLDAIAAEMPCTLDALEKIKGIGPATLGKYGSAILEIVAENRPGLSPDTPKS